MDNNIKNNKINIWKQMLGIIIDFNKSDVIKLLKSSPVNNYYLNLQNIWINYIINLHNNIINTYGLLQIIKNVELLIDSELIDCIDNQMYKIIIDVMTNINQIENINQMLGINQTDNIINGILPYIKNFKKKTYYLPLYFFYNEYMNTLPIIACMYSNIHININTYNNDLINSAFLHKNLTNIEIKPSMIANFILIDKIERKIICENLIDNLIEKHNFYNKTVSLYTSSITTIYDNDYISVRFDFNLKNLVKELFWTIIISIDGINLCNIKSDYHNKYDNIYDIIINTIFYIDGLKRDGVDNRNNNNYNAITTLINKYKYNTKSISNIYNTYSFALYPEKFQPSGAINMSKIKTFTIELIIDKNKLLNYITIDNLNKINISVNLNTLEYNIIRYQSGLSGLLFL